jgi:hypothetical protein
MGVGDSLLDKITSAIAEMDYFGVVISPHSASSDWVARELGIAMKEEVDGQRVKVIPLLLRDGRMPDGLPEKLYADFTSELLYDDSLRLLLARLGNAVDESAPGGDRLAELASSSTLLAAALRQLRGEGLANATADALVSSGIADVELSEFLALISEEISGSQLFGLAISLPEYIDKRAVGHKALQACLRPGRLDENHLGMVGMSMKHVKNPEAVVFCHHLQVTVINNLGAYHSFLQRHLDTVISRCYDDMATYLLEPDRTPSGYNIDLFELVISHVEDPRPFRSRMYDWINNGYFDLHREEEGGGDPHILYHILNEHWASEKFAGIINHIENRVHILLKSERLEYIRPGLHHLTAMVDTKYLGTERVLSQTVSQMNVIDGDGSDGFILMKIEEGMRAVAAYNRNPSDDLEVKISRAVRDIADAYDVDFTEY